MNLLIDIGNTNTKIAISGQEKKISFIKSFINPFKPGDLKQILKKNKFKKAIISSVRGYSSEITGILKNEMPFFIKLGHTVPVPVEILYKTKETLGCDRIACVVGAYTLFPASNILIIDAGTAITYDILTEQKKYIGGNISPGLMMRFNALHIGTKKLPLIEPSQTFPLLGNNTADAIIAGVQNGIIFEIDSYINTLSALYKPLRTILTGGDCFFFEKKLKNAIFAELNLAFIGLNEILEFCAAKISK
ncbi:MAG: type III pantothenate kinase [Bacteroidia bacterium]|nr:type III pantothenate kinase [Bacteroidia bacterium]